MADRKGFKVYAKSYLLFLLLTFLVSLAIGFLSGLLGMNISDMGLNLLSLGISILMLIYVSDYMRVSFWKLFGFALLVNLILSMIIGFFIFVVVF